MDSPNLLPVIIVQAVGLIVTVAAVKTTLSGHEKRIDNIEKILLKMVDHETRLAKVERAVDEMPQKYVPRNEVALMLSGISQTVDTIKSLIQALVYGGGDREIAKKALENR